MASIEVKDDAARNLIGSIISRVSALEDIEQDLEFKREVVEVIAANNQQVFASTGSAIGSDWKGNDLVRSGTLKRAYTSTSSLTLTVTNNSLIIGTSVPYASFVNDKYKFVGLTNSGVQGISQAIDNYIKRLENRNSFRR